MSEWCQNKKCPEKKNQNQIRGIKGNKYYQSYKANGYLGYWCSNGCRDTWWNEHKETCMNAVGFIGKQVLPLEDAWYVEYQYNWNSDEQEHRPLYYLRNKNLGVRQQITEQQAKTPEQISEGRSWTHINDSQARELAEQLDLVKAS